MKAHIFMTGSRRCFPALLAVFCLTAHSAHAQKPAQANPDEIGSLYLGNSQVLAAMHPRLLTKNARVAQFIGSPTGGRIAYVSEIAGPSGVVADLGVATVENGENTIYFHTGLTADNGETGQGSLIQGLYGWSDDSAYFTFGVDTPDIPTNGQAPTEQLECIDLVNNTVVPVPLPFDQLPNSAHLMALDDYLEGAAWAPGERALAFGVRATLNGGQAACLCLFDADHRATRLLSAIDKGDFRFEGWQDPTHLAYRLDNNRFAYDLATGKTAPLAAGVKLARGALAPWSPGKPMASVVTSDKEKLALTETSDPIKALDPGALGVASVLITRTGGPAKPSTLRLDSFPQGYRQSQAEFLPNAGFDRQDTYHIAYVCDGDLKVVDIAPRRATPSEKLAAGEKLTCEEELPSVVSNARQLGLGILQYLANHNSQWPGAEGLHDDVSAYTGTDSFFSSPNGEAFHYLAPAQPNLSAMADPMNTPLGEFDLPCAKVVLYADGHVKVQKNSPAAP